MLFSAETEVAGKCSAKGCIVQATHFIHWRNPKIHDANRRKTWLACDAHLDSLGDFLRLRDFPVWVAQVSEGDFAGVTGDSAGAAQ